MILLKRFLAVGAIVGFSFAMGLSSFGATHQTAGASLFSSKCAMCHGTDGKGFPAMHTPDFTSAKWQSATSNATIAHAIANGVKGTAMPAWGDKLTAAQIQTLVHYIRSLNSAKK
jgi:cytochrome c oxidase cbb3-type subunit III